MNQSLRQRSIVPVIYPGSELPRGYFCSVTPP
jgi:hypothetical protein